MSKTLLLLNEKSNENTNTDPHKIKTYDSNTAFLQDFTFDCKSANEKLFKNETNDDKKQDIKVLFSRRPNDLIKYVHLQKTPKEIEEINNDRDAKIQSIENKLYNYIMMEPPELSFTHERNLFEVESITLAGENKPKHSSGTNIFYVPTKKILALKKPKSGLFINETLMNLLSDHNLTDYDPRELQSKQTGNYRIYEKNKRKFATKTIKPPKYEPFQLIPTIKSIVRGKLTQISNENRLKASLAISVIAILYSKINNPKTWTTETIENVNRMGESLDKSLCRYHSIDQLTIFELPPDINIGPFKIEYEITPSVFEGNLEIRHIFECCKLNRGIHKIFENTFKAALIEFTVDEQIYTFGVWRKNDFYYLLDPFERDSNGRIVKQSLDQEIKKPLQNGDQRNSSSSKASNLNEKQDGGASCYHMSNKLKCISKILLENMMVICPTANFKIHALKVIDIHKLTANELNAAIKKSSRQKKSKKINIAQPLFFHVPIDSVSDVISESKINRMIIENSDNLAEEVCYEEMNRLVGNCFRKGIVEDPANIKLAKHILLKSDLPQLAKLEKSLQQTAINISESLERFSPKTTASEELKLPNNFTVMPDGVALLFGTTNVHRLENYNESVAVVASIVAMIMSHKYSINTWNGQIIDYILSTVDTFRQKYRVRNYTMFKVPKNTFPDMRFGSTVYSVVVERFNIGYWPTIDKHLLDTKSVQHYQIVISSVLFSVGIVKRNNLFYMFDPMPCSSIGYRSKNIDEDVAIVTRFNNIETLINRLHANYQQEDNQQTIILSTVNVSLVSPKLSRFRPYPESKENLLVETILNETTTQQTAIDNQLRDLQLKFEIEQCRIEEYNRNAAKYGKRFSLVNLFPKRDYLRQSMKIYDELEGNEDSHIVPITLKTDIIGDPENKAIEEASLNTKPLEVLNIYAGKTSLEDRMTLFENQLTIKACRYVSIYTLLLAVHHPICHWNYRFVDIAIDQGMKLFNNRKNPQQFNIPIEIIDKILVSDSYYNIVVEKFPLIKPKYNNDVMEALKYFFEKNKYLLIQYPNCTFALINHQDKGIYLFDSYSSMENQEQDDMEKDEEESNNETIEEKETNEVNEEDTKNTTEDSLEKLQLKIETKHAAWILFPELAQLVEYINKRIMTVEDLKSSPFIFYTIFVKNLEKAPNYLRLTNRLLIDRNKNVISEKMLPNEKSFYSDEHELGSSDKNKNILLQSHPIKTIWGTIHPLANVFQSLNRGKQYIAICSLACVMATIYPLDKWTRQLIDTCVIEGDKYFTQKVSTIQQQDYELSPKDFNGEFTYFNTFTCNIQIEYTLNGRSGQMGTNRSPLSLSQALQLFLTNHTLGILQCRKRFVAFGRNSDTKSDNCKYFAYDCQSYGLPLFTENQGCAYMIKCGTFPVFLKTLQWILRIRNKNEFSIFRVNVENMVMHCRKKDELGTYSLGQEIAVE